MYGHRRTTVRRHTGRLRTRRYTRTVRHNRVHRTVHSRPTMRRRSRLTVRRRR